MTKAATIHLLSGWRDGGSECGKGRPRYNSGNRQTTTTEVELVPLIRADEVTCGAACGKNATRYLDRLAKARERAPMIGHGEPGTIPPITTPLPLDGHVVVLKLGTDDFLHLDVDDVRRLRDALLSALRTVAARENVATHDSGEPAFIAGRWDDSE